MIRERRIGSPSVRSGFTVVASPSMRSGFTVVEVMVASLLMVTAVVVVLGGIRAIQRANVHAANMSLLQRLASEKLEDAVASGDVTTYGTQGDFSDRGYSDATWSLDIENSSATNIDEMTVTATRGKDTQTLSEYVYIQPATTTTGTTGTGTGGAGGGGG